MVTRIFRAIDHRQFPVAWRIRTRAARRCVFAAAATAVLALSGSVYAAEPPSLRAQIEALAAQHGVRLIGRDRIEQSPARPAPAQPGPALRRLLSDYNFAIIRDANGKIETVTVSGRKRPAPDMSRRVAVKTERRGASHYLNAVIVGRRPVRVSVQFLIDTGASMVVLPVSMAKTLGYRDSDLVEVVLQTANGEARGWSGVLKTVEVGRAIAHDVAVAFVEDERLGRNRLLGMSFLGRFVVTIDDAASVMSLGESSR